MMKKEFSAHFVKGDPLVVGGATFKSAYYVTDLTEEEMEIARVQLGETEEKRRQCLQELKNKLSKGRYRTDDDFLLRYLRVRKFDCEKAYENVKNFYHQRNKHPEMFGSPSNLNSYENYKYFAILPYADEEGRLIIWIDVEHWNPSKMSYEEVIQPVMAISDMAVLNPRSQVNGVISVWDGKELSASHISAFLKKNRLLTLGYVWQFTYPWRVKKIIVVNAGRLSRFLYYMFRPLLSKKLTDRIFLLGSDLSELHQHISPAILPKKLGGALEDDACINRDFIIDNIPYLEYDRSFTGE